MDELPSSDKVLVRLKCVWKARMGRKKVVALETAFMKAIESKKECR